MKANMERYYNLVIEAAKNGERLIELQAAGSSSSLFYDPDYGEFRCNFYNFVKGKSVHPKRRYVKLGKRLTLDEANLKLLDSGLDYISIKTYGGASTFPSIFIDKEYGEFESNLHLVLRGNKHPKRKFIEHSQRSKSLFEDQNYVKKWKSGIKEINYTDSIVKRKKTMKQRYGCEHSLQNPNFLTKAKTTILERYGKESYAKTELGKEKIKQIKIKNGSIKVHNGKTVKEHACELGKAYSTFIHQMNKYGIEMALRITKKHSSQELKVFDYLESEKITFEPEYEINGKFCDFLIDDKVILELDGLFWHSDKIINDKKHHQNRHALFTKNNYKCLFFREDEILKKFDIVKSMILNAIGKITQKIYARNCVIRSVNKDDCKKFLNTHHLMGCGHGKAFGLYNNEKLVSIMQIKKVSPQVVEISRFCSKVNTSIVGGFGKLLNYVISYFKPISIITFIDKRYGSGNYLLKMGFVKQKESISFKWTDGKETFHRMKFRNNSGYEKGFYKIWDCGQAKFEKKICVSQIEKSTLDASYGL